jgi:hypothetical protein
VSLIINNKKFNEPKDWPGAFSNLFRTVAKHLIYEQRKEDSILSLTE